MDLPATLPRENSVSDVPTLRATSAFSASERARSFKTSTGSWGISLLHLTRAGQALHHRPNIGDLHPFDPDLLIVRPASEQLPQRAPVHLHRGRIAPADGH